jgi:integrase/recombinase XerD
MTGRNDAAMARAYCFCNGPLAPYIDGFLGLLAGEGYAAWTVQQKHTFVADLSAWLAACQLPLDGLGEEQIDQFLAAYSQHGRKERRNDRPTAIQILRYLRSLGCIPARPQTIDRTALGDLTRDYERFLSSERGLAPATLINYLPFVRRFLIEHFGSTRLRLDELRPIDIHRFIHRLAKTMSRGRAQLMVTALRSFLRFLQQRGAITTDLAVAVPGVANWSLSHLPKSLPPDQVERLLAGCDRSTPAGRRDYAILLLLARLGLRSGEVVALTLDDLDWECGEIVVRGKGKRVARLPLPADVGAALVDYLRSVRPSCFTRQVFVRLSAPLRGFVGAAAVCDVVHRALKRAGLDPKFKGAHLLRHSLATNLLRQGASLGEIGQLLRHSQPTTTQIYAKVDIAALRTIALPWAGAVS